jgi:pyrroloquinoline quinone biosynthesis protein D
VNTPAAAPSISPDSRPRLPRGVRLAYNEAQGGWVLLAPERIFNFGSDPNAGEIGAQILTRCTGEASFEAIVDDLAATFKAPRDRISTDVAALLQGLADKKLLEL